MRGRIMAEYMIKNNGTEQRLQELTDLANDNGYDILEYQKMICQEKQRHYVIIDEWLSKDL
jgi:hypothetical protein